MYLNLTERMYEGVDEYDIPQIEPVKDIGKIDDWLSFNFIKGKEKLNAENNGVNFIIDDYNFENVWTHPNFYLDKLRKYKVVTSPDFSIFLDFPKAVKIFNHYRKHWVAKYWQEHGITVIPHITWGYEDTYNWCFSGEPKGGVVSVSNIGCMKNKATAEEFHKGFNYMMNLLQPTKVIFFYTVKDEHYMNEDIIEFIKVDRFKELNAKKNKK